MNKIMMTATSLAAGAALVLGGALAANAATPATPTSQPSATASGCTFGEHLISAWSGVPKAMRADLKAARAATGTERRTELKAVRTKALDGGYGTGVEARAKFLQSHKGDLKGVRPLPANLKADLKKLHSEHTQAAKVTEADTIAGKALAGDYGAKIETLAKDVKASSAWQDCSPAVKGS